MTEDEARTKWCPLYRTSGDEAADNRPWKSGTGVPPSTGEIDMRVAGCIGSACMSWREMPDAWVYRFREWMEAEQWIEAIKTYRNGTGSTLKDAKELVDAIRAGAKPMPLPASNGFCGLAGKP